MCHTGYLHRDVLHCVRWSHIVLKYDQNHIQNSIPFSSPNQLCSHPAHTRTKTCHSAHNCLFSEVLNQDSLSLARAFYPPHSLIYSQNTYFSASQGAQFPSWLPAFFCLHVLLHLMLLRLPPSSWPNYLPKAPPLIPSTLGISISTWIGGGKGHRHSDHSWK